MYNLVHLHKSHPYRSDRVSELHRELLGSGTKSDWGVEATCVTGVVLPIHLIQADEDGSTIVVHYIHGYVDVRFVAVIHSAH